MHALRVGGVPEHLSLPWALAAESGSFGAVGVDLTWIDQPGGTGAMTADLAKGEIDAAVLLTEGIVADMASGSGARLVATYLTSPLQWGVFVAAASDASQPTELVGRRAAISRHGSGSHLMAYVLAESVGWRLSAGDFVVVGGLDGARLALADGAADYVLWDRFMTQPLVDRGELRRIGVQPTPWPCFSVAVGAPALERRDEVASATAVALDAAAEMTRRPDVVELVSERYGLRPAVTADWLAVTEWAPSVAPPPLGVLDRIQRTLHRVGAIDTLADPTTFV